MPRNIPSTRDARITRDGGDSTQVGDQAPLSKSSIKARMDRASGRNARTDRDDSHGPYVDTVLHRKLKKNS
jgi:hypothetical protein